ncbi:P1 family peptidase [Petrotoga sp. 9PW.55.5.1]|uniref:P1 family peptidase n=1 Tax=Petrotoga sp. 9PW.55.5.1 TaxID=1308979 RepID=UPI003519EDBB
MINVNKTITAVPGIKVGHYTDNQSLTGCTVILYEEGAVGGVDVRGSAPGTRETDLLRPINLVQKVHAVLLTGGSAFGLDAASGVMQYLEENKVGFQTNSIKVPIVPAAVIYDLDIGDPLKRPDKNSGYLAAKNASSDPVEEGSIGVGTGALVGKALGSQYAMKGGVGSYSIELEKGIVVGAITVVNSTGDVYENGKIIAGALDKNKNFINIYEYMKKFAVNANAGENTTLSVVATNAILTKEEANKVAQIAHDGMARAIKPVHTMYDGDVVFCLSTGEIESNVTIIGELAAEAVEKSIIRAVKNLN